MHGAYVQFALNTEGNLEIALERIRSLQDFFNKKYNINDTLEEGNGILRIFVEEHHPGCILTVAYNDVDENYILIYDRSGFRYSKLRSPEEWRVALGTIYYVNHQLAPDIKSMRAGCIYIAECEGTMRSRISFSAISTFWYHLLNNYPVKFKQIKFFHTNIITNHSFSMMKSLMRREVRKTFHVGCQFGANIATLYRLPTPEIAKQRTPRRMEFFLKQRYDNQAWFKLT